MVFLLAWLAHAPAATLYVDLNSLNPIPPYADWTTAATNIQDAIDAASDGDQIWVNDGIYQTGGRVIYGSLTNRVAIDKAVAVESVKGPAATLIVGYQMPGTLNGDSAIRCAYLTNGASLIGFTLADGATRDSGTNEWNGGGIWCESTDAIVSNCVIIGNSAFMSGAGTSGGTIIGCQILNNTNLTTTWGGGGGAAYGLLLNTMISNNYVRYNGGGAYSCTLSNCIISGNGMAGVVGCTLSYCTLDENTNNGLGIQGGGGAAFSLLDHCLLCRNGGYYGGGAYQCELDNCVLSNNFASNRGGGCWGSATATNHFGTNDLVIGNFSAYAGGGAYFQVLFPYAASNGIVENWQFVSNSAPRNGGGLCLNTVLPVNDCRFDGNVAGGNGGGFGTDAFGYPVLASNCVFCGNSAAEGGGAYDAQLNRCTLTGNQAVSGGGVFGLANNCTFSGNVATTNGGGIFESPFGTQALMMSNNQFTNNSAQNGGGAYGDSGAFSNCVFFGNSATATGGGVYGPVLYQCTVVSNQAANGGGCAPVGPLPCSQCAFVGNFATVEGGGVDGLSTLTNCLVENNVALGNGGGIGSGGQAWRCTISGNVAAGGGGLYAGGAYYCTLANNSAAGDGGATYNSTVVDCLIVSNSAADGGGLYNGEVYDSTIIDNRATNSGGGAYYFNGGGLVGSILYYNSSPNGMNISGNVAVNYCCTVPLPVPNDGNISNAPDFIDAAAGNFRLQSNSPCINLGDNSAPVPPPLLDLDGRPRIVGGRADMGAYEYQGPGIGEFTFWLQQYGLPTDGSADDADSDGTGMNNWQKWEAGLNPTNRASVLAMLNPAASEDAGGITVTWQSVSTRTYYVQRAMDLGAQPAFSVIESNVVGQAGITSFRDTTATNAGPYFYRVGVQ